MKFAPVIIPTLNRYEHFTRCIESLRNCKYSEYTDVFIALDYPPENTYGEGYFKILEYLEHFKGFKSLTVIKRDYNYGAYKNLIDALEYVLMSYDTFILSEDDNEFSFDFLNFINQGLKTYKHRDDIFSICGYVYPVNLNGVTSSDYFLYQGFSAWGWGGWKDKYYKIDWSINNVINSLNDPVILKKITSEQVLSHLKTIVRTSYITADTIISLNQYQNYMYSIFPKVSRVRNHGNDGSGLHCGSYIYESRLYVKQKIFEGCDDYLMSENKSFDKVLNAYIDSYLKYNSITFYKNHPIVFIARVFRKIKNAIFRNV